MSLPSRQGQIRQLFTLFGHAPSGLAQLSRCGINRRDVLGTFAAASLLPFLQSGPAWAVEPAKEPPLLVIDPGHGGRDPGAIGVTGLYEKHVALTIAHDLKAAFESTGQYRVMLTRDDDVYVPLEARAAYARARNAKLFVSLHADALRDHHVRGASVYTLSFRASDAQSREIARSENSVDPSAQTQRPTYPPAVASILESLDAREARMLSVRLQRDLVKSLSDRIIMLHRPSRHADFVVLRGTDVPGVLVEMGFMSNKADELLLQSAAHRQKVVASLKGGIERCMNSFTVLTPTG